MKGCNQIRKLKERLEEAREREDARIAAQRNLFTFLPVVPIVDALKKSMLQRAYDLMWEGLTMEADAIMEFLPSREVNAMLDYWENDYMYDGEKSIWYKGE